VCGSRDWDDYKTIKNFLKTLPPDTVVIEGGARGADKIAKECAQQLGYKVEEYKAMWDIFGKGAGPIRNTMMIMKGKPDIVVAFHNDLENSKGTKDMIKQAKHHGIPVYLKWSE